MGAKVIEYTPDADSEDEEGKPQAKEYESPLEPENNLQVVANKKRGASVQQPQGTEFCQQFAWVWRPILSWSFQIRAQASEQFYSSFVRD